MPKKINIGFSGITRNTDDELSKDGECLELINARIKDGSIQPIGNPILLASLTKKYKAGYYHALADKYLLIRSEDGGVDAYSSDFSTFSILSTDIVGVDNIEIVGNIICLLKSDSIEYCLYNDHTYKYLGIRPEIPTMAISQTYKTKLVTTQDKYCSTTLVSSGDNNINNVGYSFFNECLTWLGKNGCFVDSVILKFGLRLYDGSYIYVSPPYLVQNTGIETVTFRFGVNTNDTSNDKSVSLMAGYMAMLQKGNDINSDIYEFGVLGFSPKVAFNNINLSSWKDLIVGIDVFASRSIKYNKTSTNTLSSARRYVDDSGNSIDTEDKTSSPISGTTEKYYKYVPKSSSELTKDILNEHQFYKVFEYDIEGKLLNSETDFTDSIISLNKQLEEDSYSNVEVTSNISYVYNSRLHLGGIKSNYFKGYNSDYFSPLDSTVFTKYNGTISVYLNTEYGEVIVKRNAVIPSLMTPYLAYPDNRAYKIVICANGKRKEFPLVKHRYLNYAEYLIYNQNNASSTSYTSSRTYFIPYYYVDISTWPDGVDDIVEQNTILSRPNVVKVSELNNPFIFPSKTTYQPSTRKVVGICSNTTALSQGQFGEHPLYVFCEDGIYAMTVGTDVVYATSKPLNRLVLNNSNSLRGLDQAVVFSTEQGIMLMSGTEVDNISGVINGYLPSSVDSSPIIPKIMKVAGLDTCISTSEFKDYCVNSEIGFNYREREIIISNPSYPYSYVYSMNTKTWSKMSIKIATYINAYPDILAMVSDSVTSIYNIDNNHRSVSKIAVVTRPIKMGTTTLKRILQSAMRAVIKRSLSDLYLRGEPVKFRGDDLTIFSDVGFYVLGSNDAEHFTLISGKEKMIDIRDLVTKMNKSKPYKYFMFCLVGGIRTDVALNFVECTVDESFTNRLR